MTERHSNLVVPLAHKATAMRITDTAGISVRAESGAISPLIGFDLRRSDVDSTMHRSTFPMMTMPGARTSAMATRTTTTSTTSCAPVRSADQSAPHADFSFEDLVLAYFDCRRNKRNSRSALAFEENLERNLGELHEELCTASYRPGKSVCFVITRPKPREVWAAEFRDRIVHHLLYNHISPRFYASFIADSCACIPGRGTLYAARRLEHKVRSLTQNWSRRAWYLKCDLANFFLSIDMGILWHLIAARVIEPQWRELAKIILFHDPRENYEYRGNANLIERVPRHKRLTEQDRNHGLPIGNLSSQFFANIYLDDLDQFVKHRLRAHHYIRYVDDFVILDESPERLNGHISAIEEFLSVRLHAHLNPKKTIIQPIERGIDFVGHMIKPWRRITRRRIVNDALRRSANVTEQTLFETANSYFGLLRQSNKSYSDRARLGRLMLCRGFCVSGKLEKVYRRKLP